MDGASLARTRDLLGLLAGHASARIGPMMRLVPAAVVVEDGVVAVARAG